MVGEREMVRLSARRASAHAMQGGRTVQPSKRETRRAMRAAAAVLLEDLNCFGLVLLHHGKVLAQTVARRRIAILTTRQECLVLLAHELIADRLHSSDGLPRVCRSRRRDDATEE